MMSCIPAPIQRSEVAALLPPIGEQLDLVEATYRAMARGGVEMPPKIGVHPRRNSFLHAMPSFLTGADVVGLKWVAGYPDNPEHGHPFISGIIIMNDASTGTPTAVMDASEITAVRTAAASGVCIRRWAPRDWTRVAILGCGEQARYHVKVIHHLNPSAKLIGYDPVSGRVEALGDAVDVAASPEEAAADADVVITAGPIVEDPSSPMTPAWLRQERWLLLPIDFDFYVSAALVRGADLFLTDDIGQFEAYRSYGHFNEWPAPRLTVGTALEEQRDGSAVLACNLGVGALDVAFAQAVLDRLRVA